MYQHCHGTGRQDGLRLPRLRGGLVWILQNRKFAAALAVHWGSGHHCGGLAHQKSTVAALCNIQVMIAQKLKKS